MYSVMFSSIAQACTVPDLSTKIKVTQWIDYSENIGGHAVKCHTGKKSNQLIARIENRDGTKGDDCDPAGGASSFTTQELLRDFIFYNNTQALTNMRAVVPPVVPPRYASVDFPFNGSTVGTVVRAAEKKDTPLCSNNSYVCKPAVKARLVFADVAGACVLWTAYPVVN